MADNGGTRDEPEDAGEKTAPAPHSDLTWFALVITLIACALGLFGVNTGFGFAVALSVALWLIGLSMTIGAGKEGLRTRVGVAGLLLATVYVVLVLLPPLWMFIAFRP